MKITASDQKPISPPQPQRTDSIASSPTHHSTATTKDKTTSTSLATKIERLFAQVGIRPDMEMSNDKSAIQAINRRRKMAEERRIRNLRNILNVSTSVSISQLSNDDVDIDWLFAFIGLAENINSPSMQELWGKIFAVEVSKPGSFSIRTLETLKSLTQRDAALFKQATSLASRRENDSTPRIISGYYQPKRWFRQLRTRHNRTLNLAQFGLSYPDILSLVDMKLLYLSEIESAEITANAPVKWRIGNQTIILTAFGKGTVMTYYKFTAVGSELYQLISQRGNEQYVEQLKSLLSRAFIVDG